MKLAQEGEDADGYWSGDNGASGILALCLETQRMCMAWRNPEVHQGDCYGMPGGACKDGMSPEKSALAELKEELGYSGPIQLHPSYVFEDGDFVYRNFIGVVPSEFPFLPHEDHAWETDFIQWMTLDEVNAELDEDAGKFHPGLVEFFNNAEDQIRGLLKGKRAAGPPKPMAAERTYPEQSNGWALNPDDREGAYTTPTDLVPKKKAQFLTALPRR